MRSPGRRDPWDITEERPGYHIQAEVAFRDVDPTQYAGLFVSEAVPLEYLRYDKDLLRITRHFFEANKPVAVVCHGIEIVSAAGVIRENRDHRGDARLGCGTGWGQVRGQADRP